MNLLSSQVNSPLLSNIAGFFSGPDIAIDLGTANTRLSAGARLFADVPTKTRITRRQIRRYYPAAQISNGVNSELVMPLQGGAVKDLPAATVFLGKLLKRAIRFGFGRPRVLVCAPSDVSLAERAALLEATRLAGARNVAIVPEPLAAAVGAGLDISSPYAQMLVDIGDGVTDIAVIREGSLIQTAAVRTAGSDLHRAVQKMVLDRYPVIISRNAAEALTCRLGAADQNCPPGFLKIYGVADSGEKIPVTIRRRDVCEAIAPVVRRIVETIAQTVRELPPLVCAEVAETGICLTGGVAKLPGIAELIGRATNLEVALAPAPLSSVIDGASLMLETSRQTNFWQA